MPALSWGKGSSLTTPMLTLSRGELCRRLFRQNTNKRPDTPPLIGQKDPDPSVVGPDIAPVSGIFSVPVHTAAMRSCGRARGSITTAHILVPAGRRTVNWADPGGTGDFLATPRAGDRQASASTTNSTARACVVIGAHTLEQGRSQGLRALRRQSRRNNAEYPVRYGSHGYRNKLGLATDRRFTFGTQLIRQRRNVTSGRRHCAAPAGGGHPLVRPPGDRWFCPTVVICLPGSGRPPRTP